MAGFERVGAKPHGKAMAIILCVGFGSACLCAAPAAAAPDVRRNVETLKQMARAADSDDCDTVVRLGAPLFDAPGGPGLPDEIEAIGYEILVRCEWQKGAKAQAVAHALRGTPLDHSSDALWHMRLGAQLDSKENEAATATIEAMSGRRRPALNSVPVSWMWDLLRDLKTEGKTEARGRVLRILAGDSYAPEELYGATNGFRLAYAVALMDAGDSAGARAMVGRLNSASTLAEVSVDSRLRAFLPADLDIRAAAEADLVRHRELIGLHPDRLEPIVLAASDLRELGRPQEALQLLQTASARIDDPKAFSDKGDKLNWWWDALGRTYHALGLYDDMVSAFGKGGAIGEGDNLNVSQVINLAEAQNSFGRGGDALRTLAVFDDPKRVSSPYGEMEMRFARGCAHAVAGRPADAAADVAFARAHDKDHPEALADLLLCMGDMEGAAAAFIARLDDPDRRADALTQLSDYDDPPVALPPDPVDSRLAALKARPDVKAAIERAGGVRRFRLQRGEL